MPIRLGEHVVRAEFTGHQLLIDVRSMRRLTIDPALATLCALAADGWHTRDELVAARPDGVDGEQAEAFVDYLLGRGFLHGPDTAPPDEPLPADDGPAEPLPGTSDHYWHPDAISAADLSAGPLRPLRVLMLGGCVTQFATDPLIRAGLRRGLDITTGQEWPTVRGRLRELIDRHQPDLVILQPTVQPFLTGLWDDLAFTTPAERRRRLTVCKRALSATIAELAEVLGGRTGLVHNVGPLAVSPFGRFDFRHELNHREIVAELNRHIDAEVRPHAAMAVVDEERLVARHGAARLFDDLTFPFGHHGGRPDPAVEAPNQLPDLGDALAEEYVAMYLAHRAEDRIKCVVVDLDNTLWPGIAANEGFDWVHGDTTGRWIHLGLHQALRVLHRRGVLLATCSKGTEAATMAAWATAPGRQLLGPDDFVAHRINWRSKSSNIADLCDRLGIAPSAVLFLDDNPVERAEVRRHLPGVRVPELPVHAFREFLLTEPALESAVATGEALHRTETTRAMLARAELADTGGDFLRELSVTAEVRRAGPDDLVRAAELFNRTNQFTTTALRTTPAELAALTAGGHTLWLMSVTDRFADYGVVGACLIAGDEVAALAVSCRVIGLDVAPGFLATCLAAAPYDGVVIGRLRRTDRNQPARDVFLRTGFTAAGPDEFHLAAPGRLLDLSTAPQRFALLEETRR